MYLIQDSKDLLYIVIAFSVLWLTIFLAWFIYYLAMMMREFLKIVKETRANFKKVGEAIDSLKEKIEHSASYLALIGEALKKVVDMAKEHIGDKKTKNKIVKK